MILAAQRLLWGGACLPAAHGIALLDVYHITKSSACKSASANRVHATMQTALLRPARTISTEFRMTARTALDCRAMQRPAHTCPTRSPVRMPCSALFTHRVELICVGQRVTTQHGRICKCGYHMLQARVCVGASHHASQGGLQQGLVEAEARAAARLLFPTHTHLSCLLAWCHSRRALRVRVATSSITMGCSMLARSKACRGGKPGEATCDNLPHDASCQVLQTM